MVSIDNNKNNLRKEFNKDFARFQQKVQAPPKNGRVNAGRFNYSFIDLNDLMSSVKKGMKNTNLSFTQDISTDVKFNADSKYPITLVTIKTIIHDDNGYDYTSGSLTLPVMSLNPQEVGKTITYLRRYSLGTTLGINSEVDEDLSTYNNNLENSNREASSFNAVDNSLPKRFKTKDENGKKSGIGFEEKSNDSISKSKPIDNSDSDNYISVLGKDLLSQLKQVSKDNHINEKTLFQQIKHKYKLDNQALTNPSNEQFQVIKQALESIS